jgi:hypothetical protein
MGKFNTTTVMLLDEDIRLKMQNARILMQEDIENALFSAPDNYITIKTPCLLDSFDDDVCDVIELTENGIELSCEYGWRTISELDYEQLHTVYEALKYEGNFNEVED